MNIEKSCGAVVYTKINHSIMYLIIQSINGHYGFPKGHMEKNETEENTALREIQEEVGLNVEIIQGFKTTEEYCLSNKSNTKKIVTYFLAKFDDQEITYKKDEIKSIKLLNYESAINILTFDDTKKILKMANDFIINMKEG